GGERGREGRPERNRARRVPGGRRRRGGAPRPPRPPPLTLPRPSVPVPPPVAGCRSVSGAVSRAGGDCSQETRRPASTKPMQSVSEILWSIELPPCFRRARHDGQDGESGRLAG